MFVRLGALLYNVAMPTKVRYPYPCELVPNFDTKHRAQVFIEGYQAKGYIKHCTHLSLGTYGNGFSEWYGPKCAEHSIEIEDTGYRKNLFHGCPKNCRLYQAAWRRKTKKWFKDHWWPLRRGIIGIADWYKALAPVTQALWPLLILALLALLFGIPLFDMILKALGAIFA